MDRDLSAAFIRKRRQKIIAGTAGAVILFFCAIAPGVMQGDLTLATAEMGTVESTLPASGRVVPENEFLVTSPINAKIDRVLLHAGEAVTTGQPVLELSSTGEQLTFDKLLTEQEVNRNKANQLRIGQERALNELQTQADIKKMRIQGLETALNHQRSLLKVGGGTEERVKQAALELDIARLELQQLTAQRATQLKTSGADLRSIDLQMAIQSQTISETSRKLSQAQVRSPANGIVTSVVSQVGTDVHEGTELLRIADLSSFKVEGTIADTYAAQVKPGGEVIIRINDHDLRGRVTTVEPAVADGSVKFLVSLDKKSGPLLRSNLKVDLFIITSVKNDVVRIKNGAVFNGSAEQKVFVVRGSEAIKRSVIVGETNVDFVEIRSGLKPGEVVVVNDLPDHVNNNKLVIKN